jgi:hypothetical protein
MYVNVILHYIESKFKINVSVILKNSLGNMMEHVIVINLLKDSLIQHLINVNVRNSQESINMKIRTDYVSYVILIV